MEEMVKMDIRLSKGLRDRFRAICDSQSVNGSALVRKWIQEYCETSEASQDQLVQLDVAGIVWRLSKGEESIHDAVAVAAPRLNYDADELFQTVIRLLVRSANENGSLSESSGEKTGKAVLGFTPVEFFISENAANWRTFKE